ncbi:hypothetical protein EAI_07637 [Harpegnathos saltator]|uniref:Uncharacterized protein n=1 Tax=Harpegnathos saltator TaxID=610380 RepID=E2B4N8_HARSA|nr:hypothetical protein EAI_07637 [Harpegnathos saltator]
MSKGERARPEFKQYTKSVEFPADITETEHGRQKCFAQKLQGPDKCVSSDLSFVTLRAGSPEEISRATLKS